MVGRVGQNCLYLRDRQTEISRDIGLVQTSFPILDDVIGGHTSTLQHGTAMLYIGLNFNQRAGRPIHDDVLLQFLSDFRSMLARLLRMS